MSDKKIKVKKYGTKKFNNSVNLTKSNKQNRLNLFKFNLKIITITVLIVLFSFILTLYISNLPTINLNKNLQIDTNQTELEESEPLNEQTIKVTNDGIKYLIHPDDILSGGVPKGNIGSEGGIPALDKNNINWVTVEQADEWIEDGELIIILDYKTQIRIYPFQILVFHEIANDEIDGEPILVTYCPLCGTSIIYKREVVDIDGVLKYVRFGVSGKLYNSNLIMYDELTNTYWQQIEGNAIIGELTGQQLIPIESNTITWKKFKESDKYTTDNYNEIKVLSQETGFDRNYGKDPYGSYYEEDFLLFPPKQMSSRLPPKTIVHGIKINEKYKAYVENSLLNLNQKIITDTFEDTQIIIEVKNNNEITFKNLQTNQIIIKERGMFFSWYAFHPNTKIWEGEN